MSKETNTHTFGLNSHISIWTAWSEIPYLLTCNWAISLIWQCSLSLSLSLSRHTLTYLNMLWWKREVPNMKLSGSWYIIYGSIIPFHNFTAVHFSYVLQWHTECLVTKSSGQVTSFWKHFIEKSEPHKDKGTHKFKGLSQTSLWKYRVMAISNSPQPASDNSKGGASMTLVGLLKLEWSWKTARFITTPRSSFVAPRTYTVHLWDWYLINRILKSWSKHTTDKRMDIILKII